MATWTNQNTVLTTAGKNLLSFAQAGDGGLAITKIVPGAGRVSDAQLKNQTAITDPKEPLALISKSSDAQGTIINTQLSNTDLQASYNLNQIGVYASNPNTGEVLYLISQCVSGTADTIPLPSETPTVMNFSFHLIHGEEAVVDITVANTGLVSAEVFNAHGHSNATPSKDGFMSKADKSAHNTLVTRVNQGVKTTDSPIFASGKIGTVNISADGTITGAKFS